MVDMVSMTSSMNHKNELYPFIRKMLKPSVVMVDAHVDKIIQNT
jgi:hypothetical protein